jgi:release factor glutamine methyltransferase
MNKFKFFNLPLKIVSEIRAEKSVRHKYSYQVAYINLLSQSDPSAILKKDKDFLTILSDKHSYSKNDRIFPINQDENTVFAQYVYKDSKKYKYKRVLDIATGSGVMAVASAKAGAAEVIATDINRRTKFFVELNSRINKVKTVFLFSNLFQNVAGKFNKITINPPFMPAPSGVFPLHAQGGYLGVENVVEPFFKQVWKFVEPGGCIQGVFHSFANDELDTVLQIVDKNLPNGWSYKVNHVFPIKNIPIELYTAAFIGQKGYKKWIEKLNQKKLKYSRFFMLTLRNDGRMGFIEDLLPKPRIYNLIYPPTILDYLKRDKFPTILLKKHVSEEKYPMIGHLLRLSRYNYFVYIVLANIFL